MTSIIHNLPGYKYNDMDKEKSEKGNEVQWNRNNMTKKEFSPILVSLRRVLMWQRQAKDVKISKAQIKWW